jgi:peptidoglycan/xylan/chitin deacetylase (PgdA/CDA1 family)
MGLIMIPASRWVQGMMALLALVITIAVVPVPRPASPPGPVAIAAPMKGSFHPAFLDTAELTAPIPTAYTQLPAVLYGVQTTTPAIALTFDLDMTPGMLADLRAGVVTSWINTNALAYLKETHTPATLFMTGMWAETYPQLARQLAQSGQFEIANHSYSHTAFHHPCYGLASSGTLGNDWQVTQAQKAIQRITGVLPRLFRFPGGCYNPAAVAAVHRLGLQPVEWTVNSLDAFNRNPG